jgi:hypothetical protein
MARLKLLGVSSALLLLGACTAPLAPTIKGEARELQALRSEVAQAVRAAPLFLLPASGDPAAEAAQVTPLLSEVLAARRPELRLIPLPEAERRFPPVRPQHAEILAALSKTGTLPRAQTAALGQAVGARYLLQPRLLFQRSDVESQVVLSLQLWDAQEGTILWEGQGRATGTHTAQTLFGAVPIPVSFPTLVRTAGERLAARLP